MDNSGLKNEQLLSELIENGSTVIKTKNEFGVHIFSGSINDDGVVFGKLVKPKYNESELRKSIDTNIVELIPITPVELEDTVLRSIYNIATQSINDLTDEVAVLNGTILGLESKITDLQLVTQSLRFELDTKDLTIASLENQNQQITLRVQSTILDLQNAIQRATSEAIQRVSLTARNEALVQEIDALRTELFDTREKLEQTVDELTKEASINSELEKGAFGGIDITANPIPKTDASQPPITWRGQPKYNYSNGNFINGGTISIFNATDETVIVNFTQTGIDFLTNLSPVTVPPKGFGTKRLSVSLAKVDNYKRLRDTADVGELVVSTNERTISIPMELQIQRGSDYRRP